ncbi:MAG TPA: bifunctional 5,10-methylenetetrahydrofolate dehydrogenase/5,10-methenyltetrahydrofolate cyclohydrolase [Candidatus Binataceae bacterium]|nr:bifunctional 5,10-methylenetetrahydrofolate dehydrogenase/5,10-methenyltetrahydrofolate cyclohydrolase [Candidatus Binataceae bacterium]
MPAVIMDGRAVSAHLMPELRHHAAELRDRHGVVPSLAAILVGDDPASRQYVKNKRRFTIELGCESQVIHLDTAQATTDSMLDLIARLNADPKTTGILIQLPLPELIDRFRLFDAIAPLKDVDAVGAQAVSGFYRGQWGTFLPCTPRGVLTLLDYYKVPVDGARAAVIGRSDIAGKPTAFILGGRLRNATVTWCHRHTRNLEEICRSSDLIVSCVGANVGREFLINADMVKPGACVIDVGFRRTPEGKFAGDVDFDAVQKVAGWITLNPGGTGPMTVVGLMQNLIDAARYQIGLPRAQYSI